MIKLNRGVCVVYAPNTEDARYNFKVLYKNTELAIAETKENAYNYCYVHGLATKAKP